MFSQPLCGLIVRCPSLRCSSTPQNARAKRSSPRNTSYRNDGMLKQKQTGQCFCVSQCSCTRVGWGTR